MLKMDDLQVRIVQLEPMRLAAVLGFGIEPEGLAWNKMNTFVKANGFHKDGILHRYFGFNNPNPAPGSPAYGYEVWVTLDEDFIPSGEVKIIDFPGGMYAVTGCKGVESIFPTWQKLALWRENSSYSMANHQWLEEHIGPLESSPEELVLDLFLPVRK
jgi:AraC family transcriptional regulator